MRTTGLQICMLAAVAFPLAAQSKDSAKTESIPVIQDNSFLVEEAYNQGAGVVQHMAKRGLLFLRAFR